MTAVIRSWVIGAARTRLRTDLARLKADPPTDGVDDARQRMRAEIEAEVRDGMAAHMQALCDIERKNAQVAGHAQGLADGHDEAVRALARSRQELAERVETALMALARAHAEAIERFDKHVGEVAFNAVCRIVGADVATRSLTLGMIEQVCLGLRPEMKATVRLHPRDLAILGELVSDESIRVGSLGLRVAADEKLALGGCFVESTAGDYDGNLENQLRRLHAVLTGANDESSPDDLQKRAVRCTR